MKKLFRFGMFAAGCGLAATFAHAAIFYSDEDTIFVGKGDYQTACGLNNAQAQTGLLGAGIEDWSIDSTITTEVDVTCEWETVTGKESKTIKHSKTKSKSTSVSKTLASYDARKKTQITGIFLDLGDSVVVGDGVPAVGADCPTGPGVVTKVSEPVVTTSPESIIVDCDNNGDPTTPVGVVG